MGSELFSSEEFSSEEFSFEEFSSEELSSEEFSSVVSSGSVYVLTEEQSSQLSNINATVTFVTIIIGTAFIIWLLDFVVKKLSSYL